MPFMLDNERFIKNMVGVKRVLIFHYKILQTEKGKINKNNSNEYSWCEDDN